MSAILGDGGGGGSVVDSYVPYISTLSLPELEKLGLKAVSAGAKPFKLQQAFADAQTNGDWSELEILIADALGEEALKNPNTNNIITGFASNFIGKPLVLSQWSFIHITSFLFCNK